MNALKRLLKDDWEYPECPGCMIDCEFEPEIFDLEKCKSKKQFKSYREVHVRKALLAFADELDEQGDLAFKEIDKCESGQFKIHENAKYLTYKNIASEIRKDCSEKETTSDKEGE